MPGVPDLHILAISGSLRAHSSNSALLDAVARLAPPGVHIEIDRSLGKLPHFNPDLDEQDSPLLPASVAALRSRIGAADGLLLSTPEYAHGMPGSFKNLLDWLVASTEFPNIPVAILNPSARAQHAPAQLVEVLTTMNAHLVTDASVTIPLSGRSIDGAAAAADPVIAGDLRAALGAFVRAVRESPRQRPRAIISLGLPHAPGDPVA